MFGTSTGDGFGEPAAYDPDRSGWADEGDPVSGQLRIWAPQEEQALSTPAGRGAGAIAAAAVAAPFSLKGSGNELPGQMRAAEVFFARAARRGRRSRVTWRWAGTWPAAVKLAGGGARWPSLTHARVSERPLPGGFAGGYAATRGEPG